MCCSSIVLGIHRPFTPKLKNIRISKVVRIGSIIIFYLSKCVKAKFFKLCDVIFVVRLQEKFEMITVASERVKGLLFVCFVQPLFRQLMLRGITSAARPNRLGSLSPPLPFPTPPSSLPTLDPVLLERWRTGSPAKKPLLTKVWHTDGQQGEHSVQELLVLLHPKQHGVVSAHQGGQWRHHNAVHAKDFRYHHFRPAGEVWAGSKVKLEELLQTRRFQMTGNRIERKSLTRRIVRK